MGKYKKIPYSSFCWKFGTTSFRTQKFNKMTEWQLRLLKEFWEKSEYSWQGWEKAAPGQNDIYEIKTKYYDWLVENNFMEGGEDFNGKFKTARNKTSGLYDMGFINSEHRLTEVGKSLLEISQTNDFLTKNELGISKDSEIYLKQLLKVSNKYDNHFVRPLIVALYLLDNLDYLSNDEFCYLMPLCMDNTSTAYILNVIKDIRKGIGSLDESIIHILLDKSNYKEGLERFISNDFSPELLLSVGMNRKSAKYDKAYIPLYSYMHAVYMEQDVSKIIDLLACLKKFQSSIAIKWKKLLFKVHQTAKIKKNPQKYLKMLPVGITDSEKEFKKFFFITMHLFKAKATLEDYLDLNRRYLGLSNIFLFENDEVRLDIVPKYFFKNAIHELYEQAFQESTLLYNSCSLVDICPSLVFDEKAIINGINLQLGTNISTLEETYREVDKLQYERFSKLVDEQFTDDKLLLLLDDFEKRDDEEINNLVTDNADIPTIFEYIIGIIWWKVSGKQGKALDYMKLSLDSNLLPITHAAGGEADLVWEYKRTNDYPEHSLLLEATLADSTNQRRMEMEPVSRHLGNNLVRSHNMANYCVFATNYLYINVLGNFRDWKHSTYYDPQDPSNKVRGMKIIPIETEDLKSIVRYHLTYAKLYVHFQKAYDSDEMDDAQAWYEKYVNIEYSNLCPKRKLKRLEYDDDVFRLIQNIRNINPAKSEGYIQIEVQKEYGHRYDGMTSRDWRDLITSYLKPVGKVDLNADTSTFCGMAADELDNRNEK